jgi:hypothetical protein
MGSKNYITKNFKKVKKTLRSGAHHFKVSRKLHLTVSHAALPKKVSGNDTRFAGNQKP